MEDLSDEMFAARHLRYEIYEKKQIQPLLKQRRRSRSNRSESEHSLTASANPRSPDTVVGAGSESVGESVFGCSGSDDTAALNEATVCQLPEQTALPTVDVRLCRISSSALATLTQTGVICSEAGHTDIRTHPLYDSGCSSWPTRSFPLVDADCPQLQAVESSCSSTVSAGLLMPVDSDVSAAGPFVTDSTNLVSVTGELSGDSIPNITHAAAL